MAPNIVRSVGGRETRRPRRMAAQWTRGHAPAARRPPDLPGRAAPRRTQGPGRGRRQRGPAPGADADRRRVPTYTWSPRRSPLPSRASSAPARCAGSSAASRTRTSTAPGTSWPPPTTPAVNERVSELAEERRIFCVRADDAYAATAFTPAVGRHAGDTIAVMGSSAGERDPRRHASLRDEIVTAMREGALAAQHHRDHGPGVVLVGGGPGDPELISVAGRKALMEADIVVADRLAPASCSPTCRRTPRSSTSPSCRAAVRRSRSRSTR